jgi:hypothetical protein
MSDFRDDKKSKQQQGQPPLDHHVPMLQELFFRGAPVNNTTLKGGKQVGNLSDECLQYIIFRSYQNWKLSQIADSLGIKINGVKYAINLFRRNSEQFYEAKIVVKIADPGGQGGSRFLCRIHGEQFMRNPEANNHLWEEMFG